MQPSVSHNRPSSPGLSSVLLQAWVQQLWALVGGFLLQTVLGQSCGSSPAWWGICGAMRGALGGSLGTWPLSPAHSCVWRCKRRFHACHCRLHTLVPICIAPCGDQIAGSGSSASAHGRRALSDIFQSVPSLRILEQVQRRCREWTW